MNFTFNLATALRLASAVVLGFSAFSHDLVANAEVMGLFLFVASFLATDLVPKKPTTP